MTEAQADIIAAVEPAASYNGEASSPVFGTLQTMKTPRLSSECDGGSDKVPDIEPLDVSESLDTVAKARSRLRIYTILIALCLVLFIAALDQTIVATAIPSITADLHSAAGYTWVGGAYLLANAAAGPVWAKCSDIWGRKRALLAAVIVFAVASVLAATSRRMSMLIAARAIQGAAGGGMMQLVAITISDLFSIRHRALYVSVMALVWVLAGTTGPVLGGALSEYASWRWCFWINLPVCVMAILVLLLFLDVHDPRTKLSDGLKAIDWFGTVSIVGVTVLLLLGLDFGGVTFPWHSPTVICMIVFGILLIGFFLFAEKRLSKYPLIYLDVFKQRGNVAAFLVAISHSMAYMGSEYYLPLYFQSVKQASPAKSGLMILPMMIAASVSELTIGVIIHRTGRYREIIWAGTAFLTLGTGLYIMLGVDTSLGKIIGFQIIGGIGLASLLQSPGLAIQNSVSQADTATAIATVGFIRNLSTSLTIVLGSVVFQNSMSARHSSLAATGLNGSTLDALSGNQAAAHLDLIKTISEPAQKEAVRQAFAWSIRNMFIMYTGIAAVGLVASAFTEQRYMSTEHTETKTGIDNMRKRDQNIDS